jgi:hypothetical protein
LPIDASARSWSGAPFFTTYIDGVFMILELDMSAFKWIIDQQKQDLSGLVYQQCDVPQDVGPDEVLVQLHAASLNYRDLVLAQVPTSPTVSSEPGLTIIRAPLACNARQA